MTDANNINVMGKGTLVALAVRASSYQSQQQQSSSDDSSGSACLIDREI